ncbi:alpha/beta fold hydrolase [Paraburkholderia dipogonis]|uniref:alpha/beta fold hydrolase n=1 Tax=Paraburkholderia dipogonis TaxID=1211383 RepID=UPI00361CA4DA
MGPSRRPLVVLLHGGGQTRHAWGATGASLGEAGYFAVAYDARGHGDSDWCSDGDYSQDALVRDLGCVVAALGTRRPVLIGASLGGATSLVAIGERRLDASALILVDIVPYTEPSGVARIRTFMQQSPHGFGSLEEVADAISRYRPAQVRTRNLDGLAKNVRLGGDGRYRWHWDPRFLASQVEPHTRHPRLAACASHLNLPTLLVRGGTSDVVSEAGVQEFLELCPHSEYVNVAQAGHMVAGDRNDVFGRAAIEFLARKVPVAGPMCHPMGPIGISA